MNDYPHWRDRLAYANDPAFWPIETLDRLLESGDAQFWCDGTSAVVTRFITYPGGAIVVEVLAAAGNLEHLWGEIAPQVEALGAKSGVKRLRAMGRFGWSRSSRAHGWRSDMVLIEKDLTP